MCESSRRLWVSKPAPTWWAWTAAACAQGRFNLAVGTQHFYCEHLLYHVSLNGCKWRWIISHCRLKFPQGCDEQCRGWNDTEGPACPLQWEPAVSEIHGVWADCRIHLSLSHAVHATNTNGCPSRSKTTVEDIKSHSELANLANPLEKEHLKHQIFGEPSPARTGGFFHFRWVPLRRDLQSAFFHKDARQSVESIVEVINDNLLRGTKPGLWAKRIPLVISHFMENHHFPMGKKTTYIIYHL